MLLWKGKSDEDPLIIDSSAPIGVEDQPSRLAFSVQDSTRLCNNQIS